MRRWAEATAVPVPGWMDRLSSAIAESRVSEPAVYGVAWLAVFALITAVQWPTYEVKALYPLHAVLAAGVVLPVYLARIFNSSAGAAMRRVRPLLAIDDAEAATLTAALKSTPVVLELVVTAFWLGVTALRIRFDPSSAVTINLSFVGGPGVVAVILVGAFVISIAALGVKIAYMGWTISHIPQRQLSVSLWELGPLHGFSVLTAQFAGSLIALAAAIYAARPSLLSDQLGIAAGLFGVFFAAAVFVVPLVGIHDRLVAEKGRLRGEAARTMEAAVKGLHASIKAGDLAAMDAHYKAVAAIEIEMRTLSSIPTWPWLPDTFRWVVGALTLPFVLLVIQLVLTRTSGG